MDDPDIPVAPLADMVFLLLAFLVCVAVLKAGSDAVHLPETHAATPAQIVTMPTIVLTLEEGDRTVRIDGGTGAPQRVRIDAAALVDALAAARAAHPGAEIILRADAAAPYRAVRQVLDAARTAGMPEVVIAGRPAGR